MKFIYIVVSLFISNSLIAQKIGYEWIKAIKNTSEIVSAIDNENNILIAGSYSGTLTIDGVSINSEGVQKNTFLAKLTKEGDLVWLINDTINYTCAITVDKYNNIYLTGTNQKYTSNGNYTFNVVSYIYLAKFDSFGNRRWVITTNEQTINNSIGNRGNEVTSIAVDTSGFVYITGSYYDTISFDTLVLYDNNLSAIFITKFDSLGTPVWARRIFGANSNDASGKGNDIIVDNNNFVYVTGYFWSSSCLFGDTLIHCNGIDDIFLTKLDENGVFLKTISLGGVNSDEGCRLAVDKNNGLILMAKFSDTISINGNIYYSENYSNNVIIIKFINDAIVFATQIGTSNGGAINGDICLDKSQNIIYTGAVQYQSLSLFYPLFPMIYRINNSGSIDWKYMIAQGTVFENPKSMSHTLNTDADGEIYVTGTFVDSVYFGDSLFVTDTNYTYAFIGKIDTTMNFGASIFDINYLFAISVFPSLTNGPIYILSHKLNLENSEVNIYNTSGVLMKRVYLSSNSSIINISDLKSGFYIINIYKNGFNGCYKIMKY